MPISNNDVVSFHYRLFDSAGLELESSSEQGVPQLYLHGADNLMPGLEQAMAGRNAGDHFEVTLSPEQAFGMRDESRVQRISAKYLKHEGKLTTGKIVRLHTEDSSQLARVLKVGKFSVDVDLNHPFAGQPVRFAIEIVDVRPATDEEKAHGHAHGAGGHHHE